MKTLLITFFLSLPVVTQSQSNWNITKTLSFPNAQITDMIADDDNVIVFGDAFNNSTEWKQGLIIAKIDSTGNILQETFVLDPIGDKLAVSQDWGKIIQTADGGFAATAATVFRNSAFLIKLNNNLEVEFIREYPDSVNLSNYDYKLKTVQGGYLLYGSIQLPDYYLQGFVKYVDFEGEIIWEKFYSKAPYGTRILDLDQVNDSLFVFVTTELLEPHIVNQLEKGRSGIYFVNNHGDMVTSWQSAPDPEIGFLRKVLATPDSSIITYGVAVKQIIGTTKLLQPTLAKFSPTLSMVWLKNIGNIRTISNLNTMHRFSPTIDGNYVGFGGKVVKSGTDISRAHGWIYKFSPQGDSIWGHDFPTPFPDAYPNGGTLYGGGILSSGSMIAGGSATDGQNNYCWIVKITNEGCMDTIFCQTSAVRQPEEPVSNIQIYPNPAVDYFQVESPVEMFTVTLLDGSGRKVLESFERGRRVDIQVPAEVASGLYFVRIEMAGGGVVLRKLIVQNKGD